jgi:CheY-like chemotaxis protein
LFTPVRLIQAQKNWGEFPPGQSRHGPQEFPAYDYYGMKDHKIPHARKPIGPLARGETDRPIRLLVVEDDPGICQLCAVALITSGYQMGTAEDGSVGWEALQASNYDLLITDNAMPKMSGVDLVKMLRSARMTLPVVMASGTLPAEALNGDSSLQLAATLLSLSPWTKCWQRSKKSCARRRRLQAKPSPLQRWPAPLRGCGRETNI